MFKNINSFDIPCEDPENIYVPIIGYEEHFCYFCRLFGLLSDQYMELSYTQEVDEEDDPTQVGYGDSDFDKLMKYLKEHNIDYQDFYEKCRLTKEMILLPHV